jgi:hypothetical protein
VVSDLNPLEPIVIILDGFDELVGDIRETTEILSKAIAALPRNVKIFITSRPEHDVQTFLFRMMSQHRATHINLDTSDPSSIKDVALYFRERIGRIMSDIKDEEEWPGEDAMQVLCEKASGLFIWAATAIKFIRARISADGSECLDDVLKDLNAEGMEDIDALYYTILNRTCPRATDSAKDSWPFERFRRIVGCIAVLQEPLALASLKGLLNLRKTEKSRPVDIEHFIRQLRTVLVSGTDDITDTTIPRLHKSFVEFIIKDCAGDFRVNMAKSHMEVAIQCLRQLSGLKRDMCNIEHLARFNTDIPDLFTKIDEHLSAPLRYACRFWSIHLHQAKSMTDVTVHQLFRDFFFRHLLHWIETMSLLDYNAVFSSLETAALFAQVCLSRRSSLTYN